MESLAGDGSGIGGGGAWKRAEVGCSITLVSGSYLSSFSLCSGLVQCPLTQYYER